MPRLSKCLAEAKLHSTHDPAYSVLKVHVENNFSNQVMPYFHFGAHIPKTAHTCTHTAAQRKKHFSHTSLFDRVQNGEQEHKEGEKKKTPMAILLAWQNSYEMAQRVYELYNKSV